MIAEGTLVEKIADALGTVGAYGGSPSDAWTDAETIAEAVRDHRAVQAGWSAADRESIDELIEAVRTCRDRAHWLAVHRRMALAHAIEAMLDAVYRLGLDLRGRHARKEPL